MFQTRKYLGFFTCLDWERISAKRNINRSRVWTPKTYSFVCLTRFSVGYLRSIFLCQTIDFSGCLELKNFHHKTQETTLPCDHFSSEHYDMFPCSTFVCFEIFTFSTKTQIGLLFHLRTKIVCLYFTNEHQSAPEPSFLKNI